MSKEDLIVWFDTKTGEAMSEENQVNFLNEVQDIARKYDHDFSMCSHPEGMYNFLKRLDNDGYFEDLEILIDERIEPC